MFSGHVLSNRLVRAKASSLLNTLRPFKTLKQGAAVSLYVSFMIFACHVRKPAWYLYPDNENLGLPVGVGPILYP